MQEKMNVSESGLTLYSAVRGRINRQKKSRLRYISIFSLGVQVKSVVTTSAFWKTLASVDLYADVGCR
jgi:hypothetical protein